MTIKKRILIVLLLLATPGALRAQPAAASIDVSFANSLFHEQDYYRAITEYKRFLHLHPDSPTAVDVRYAIGLAYFRSEKWDVAAEAFQAVREADPAGAAGSRATLMAAEAAYRKGDFPEALDAFSAFVRHHSADPSVVDARMRIVQCYLQLGNIRHARDQAAKVHEENAADLRMKTLLTETAAVQDVPAKSPALAGTLSALVPGAGQLYIGRPRDAGVSFLINGSMIALAAVAFHNDEPVAGGIVALVELSWYTGNIYGAVNGAHKYNRHQRRRFVDSLDVQCGIMQDADREWLPTGGIRVRF
jgi:outer membrane protein assembly factor BamD (BamD/ComL family)